MSVLPTKKMTVTYSKHDKEEDEEEEECPGGQIHDGRGEAEGDVAEVRHGHRDQRDINCARNSLNLNRWRCPINDNILRPTLFLFHEITKNGQSKCENRENIVDL